MVVVITLKLLTYVTGSSNMRSAFTIVKIKLAAIYSAVIG
jgi:hypothetical protein